MPEDVLRDSVSTRCFIRWYYQLARTRTGSLVRLRDRVCVALATSPTRNCIERLARVRPTLATLLAAFNQQERCNACTRRVHNRVFTMLDALR